MSPDVKQEIQDLARETTLARFKNTAKFMHNVANSISTFDNCPLPDPTAMVLLREAQAACINVAIHIKRRLEK